MVWILLFESISRPIWCQVVLASKIQDNYTINWAEKAQIGASVWGSNCSCRGPPNPPFHFNELKRSWSSSADSLCELHCHLFQRVGFKLHLGQIRGWLISVKKKSTRNVCPVQTDLSLCFDLVAWSVSQRLICPIDILKIPGFTPAGQWNSKTPQAFRCPPNMNKATDWLYWNSTWCL